MNRAGLLADVGTGALVTVFLSFLPFSSVLGGAVAASRRDGGYIAGFGTGLAAGLVAMVPLLALLVPSLSIAGTLGFGVGPSAPAYEVFIGLVFLFFFCYTAGLSALGGIVGVWARDNTDWNLDPQRWV